MDSELLLKFIGYFPGYFSVLSCTYLRFFGQPLWKQLYVGSAVCMRCGPVYLQTFTHSLTHSTTHSCNMPDDMVGIRVLYSALPTKRTCDNFNQFRFLQKVAYLIIMTGYEEGRTFSVFLALRREKLKLTSKD